MKKRITSNLNTKNPYSVIKDEIVNTSIYPGKTRRLSNRLIGITRRHDNRFRGTVSAEDMINGIYEIITMLEYGTALDLIQQIDHTAVLTLLRTGCANATGCIEVEFTDINRTRYTSLYRNRQGLLIAQNDECERVLCPKCWEVGELTHLLSNLLRRANDIIRNHGF
jgi:hypothetical protein